MAEDWWEANTQGQFQHRTTIIGNGEEMRSNHVGIDISEYELQNMIRCQIWGTMESLAPILKVLLECSKRCCRPLFVCIYAGLHKLWQPGSLAARKWREKEKIKRKWRENEEMERK